MNKAEKHPSLLHSRALYGAATCLLLTTGIAMPAFASQESSSVPSINATQQNTVTVRGSVKDTNGEPIIGASIVEKGNTGNGSVTDLNGNYTLHVRRGARLIVSYIGFQSQEIPASQSTITLQEDNKSLNEVVVIGYGTQKKGDITSAITSIKSKDFTQGNIKDAGDLIKGKVAGLTITNGSGDPSVTSAIRLRGVLSLSGNNTPLVLVDGIEGSLSTVAPEDIASIDVLKDASAAAIYGTRGAAGVIIITTKNGQRNSKTTVNYSGYLTLSGFCNKLDMMDGGDIRAGKTDFKDKGYDTDWLDAVTRTAFTHNHNLAIRGGNNTTTYSADFTYRNQQGVFINTYGDEMHFVGDLAHWFFDDKVKIAFNLVKHWHKNGPVDAAGTQVYRQAIMRNPTEPIYNSDGSYYENMAINYYMNPIALLKEHTGEYKTEDTRLTGNITVEPIKGWKTNLMMSTDRSNAHDEGFRPSMEQRGITLDVTYPPQDFLAVVDAEGLTKIISNLMTNATKYTHDHVDLSCHVDAAAGRYMISVADNGAGISAEDREKIFRPFFQAKDNKPGTGIGLSIVHNLVEAHDGEIKVESEPGQGTRMIVELPVTPVPSLASLTVEATKAVKAEGENEETKEGTAADEKMVVEAKNQQEQRTQQEIVLIVEDDPDMSHYIAKNFQPHYQVLTAGNGCEALDVLSKHAVTLIVSDWMMPEMDGAALCRSVRSDARTSHIPFIMLTAKTDDASKTESMDCGADAFIEKPFSMQYLEACIRNMIAMRRRLMQRFAATPTEPVPELAKAPMDNALLRQMNEIIEENLGNPDFNVQMLAERLNISRSGLFAKVKAITDTTPNEMIQIIRLRKAARLLKTKQYRVSEVAYQVGFNNPSYFSKCFQKQFGVKPGEY